MLKTFCLIVLGLGLTSSSAFATESVVKLSALANGQLLLDGRPVTLAALDSAFAALKSERGVVWYYRENAASEPSPEAMKAVELVIKHQLPISMSTKPDFSDVVDANGQSRPREP